MGWSGGRSYSEIVMELREEAMEDTYAAQSEGKSTWMVDLVVLVHGGTIYDDPQRADV